MGRRKIINNLNICLLRSGRKCIKFMTQMMFNSPCGIRSVIMMMTNYWNHLVMKPAVL